jgi:acetolactate synthase-1/2/3 large subunit
MEAIQQIVVDGSDAIVLAEGGNSYAWATHLLQFDAPGRFRVSTGWGSMGHAATGVLGAALGSGRKAVAIVGDGAMLMSNEISTAVQYNLPSVWIVLNDGSYAMVAQGMAKEGYASQNVDLPQSDFTLVARGVGADGVRVERISELKPALEAAMRADGPFVVDVMIDPTHVAPFLARVESLIAQERQSRIARSGK